MPAQEAAPDGTPRQVFGAMLRYYRLKAGLTQDQLAALAHVSGKLVSAYESGWRVPTRSATADLDAVSELSTNGALTELWDQFKPAMSYQPYPRWFHRWPDKEAEATSLRWFELVAVPGLLQTEDYAWAMLRTQVLATDDEIDAMVKARLSRQSVLYRECPPMLWVIIDEMVLRRPVGGNQVMTEQLTSLIEASLRPNVVLQVMPLAVGAHQGMSGNFVIADFANSPPVVYQDTATCGQIVEDAGDLAAVTLIWDTLRSEVLPRKSSLGLLEEVAKSWTSQA